ncbi:MAG: hypothetical protein OXT05_02795, partial [Chloroflexota bacterium]|nr:hypothetical protein [Chloroflexota bacterium]
MRIAGTLAVIVPVVIMMVMPAQAVDFSGSTQGLNMRMAVLVRADDSGKFRIVSVTVEFLRHFVSMILMGMLVIVLVISVVILVGMLIVMLVVSVVILVG